MGSDKFRGFIEQNDTPNAAKHEKDPDHRLGNYSLEIDGAVNKEITIDRSGLFRHYYTDYKENPTLCDLISGSTSSLKPDPYNISEFLVHGIVHENRTLFGNVKWLGPDEKLIRNKKKGNNTLKSVAKGIVPSLTHEKSTGNFIDRFQNIAELLSNEKLSVDITGGTDSRLIVSLLRHFEVPFETVFMCGKGDQKELKICEKVVTKLGVPFHCIKINEEYLYENLDEVIKFADGGGDLMQFARLLKMQKWRKQKGYSLAINGVGGELYKDFWWQQDFPFYRSGTSRIRRLYMMRMYPDLWPVEYLNNKFRKSYEEFLSDILIRLKAYLEPMNSMTYDRIYREFKIQAMTSKIHSCAAQLVPLYSPLMEPDLVSIGYNLPRRTRFFNNFHRKMISELSPEISGIPTTDGNMSTDHSYSGRAADIFRYVTSKSSKVYSRFAGKTVKINEDLSEYFPIHKLQESVNHLTESGILNRKLNYLKLSRKKAHKIISLSYILKLAGH